MKSDAKQRPSLTYNISIFQHLEEIKGNAYVSILTSAFSKCFSIFSIEKEASGLIKTMRKNTVYLGNRVNKHMIEDPDTL